MALGISFASEETTRMRGEKRSPLAEEIQLGGRPPHRPRSLLPAPRGACILIVPARRLRHGRAGVGGGERAWALLAFVTRWSNHGPGWRVHGCGNRCDPAGWYNSACWHAIEKSHGSS